MIESFITGCVIGAIMIGASVERTLCVGRGLVLGSLMCNALASISYYYSVFYVVEKNLEGFIGTCVGSSIVLAWMAVRKKKKMEVLNEKSKNV